MGPFMMTDPKRNNVLRLLLDTNIWLDYFLARSTHHAVVDTLIASAANREDIALYVTSLSLKDIAYQLAAQMQADVRRSGKRVDENSASAAREVAWGCVRNVLEKAIVLPIGYDEVLRAFTFKPLHDDLEDDLVLGAMEASGVAVLVTHDQKLAKHAEGICFTAEEALALLDGRG